MFGSCMLRGFGALAVLAACSRATIPATARSRASESHWGTAHDSNELGASDLDGIRREYERNRHAVFAVPGGYRARNLHQQWVTQFDGHGFVVVPASGQWNWGLQLESYGRVGQARMIRGRALITVDKERVSYEWEPNLSEWWVNGPGGLEHGYTLRERPAGIGASIRLRLRVRGGLIPRLLKGARGVNFVDAEGRAEVTYAGLIVRDAEGREFGARMQVAGDTVTVEVDDPGACYPLTIDPTAQQAYLKASNTGNGGWFGYSVAISGDTVVIGEPLESSKSTGVNGDQSDSTANYSGAAYVFVRNAGVWTQQAYLKASNAGPADRFGSSVAVSGDTIVVGAPYETSSAKGVNGDQTRNRTINSGAAYVFVRSAGVWTQQAYLKGSNTQSGNEFGTSVAVSADTVVAGAYQEGSSATGVNGNQSQVNGFFGAGAAYVFVRNAGVWTQQAYLKASNTVASLQGGINAQFGLSVAVSGDTVMVGAPRESSNATGVDGNQSDHSTFGAGAAYVFVRNASVWTQQAYLKASNAAGTTQYKPGDEFGNSVAVSDHTVVVGAFLESGNATGVNGNQKDRSMFSQSGAAYVFERAGTQWSQQAYLKASNNNGMGDDVFGWSVAVSGDQVVVGAPHDSHTDATPVYNGRNFSSVSGSAFVFRRNAGVWTQSDFLKASTIRAGDNFGWSVAVSGSTALAGAQQESSKATGVNGDQSDSSVYQSGAAYTFLLAPPPVITSVTNAFGGSSTISGNTWITIKGTNLASNARTWQDSDFVNNKMPTVLDGVGVTVNGKAAYVYFISQVQINILTSPDELSGPVAVQVTVGEVTSNVVNAQAQAESLSFFEFVSSSGFHYVYGRHAADNSMIGPTTLFPGLTTPVKPGESIYIGATGFGKTDVPIASGALSQGGNLPLPFPVIKVGGIPVTVSFAGLVAVGTYQINFVIPQSAPDGDLALTATYSGLSIQPNLLITVQH